MVARQQHGAQKKNKQKNKKKKKKNKKEEEEEGKKGERREQSFDSPDSLVFPIRFLFYVSYFVYSFVD